MASQTPASKPRAVRALTQRLKEVLPTGRAALIDDKGRTERFEDNLLPSLSTDQIRELRRQLMTGDGHELDYGKNGERPDAHAANSSAALACNAFGIWIGREHALRIDGIGGFSEPLKVEAKQRIFRGGRHPNLDGLAVGDDVVMGIESKLTEPLARHGPSSWSDAYGRDSCRALLSGGWQQALDEARTGVYNTEYLDVAQLLKHALGVSKQHPGRERHLLYVHWEPTDGDALPEVRTHRQEVLALHARVGDGSPRLHTLTYAELWAQWEALDMSWLTEHVDQLGQRYALALP
jgi:hypothetical protein